MIDQEGLAQFPQDIASRYVLLLDPMLGMCPRHSNELTPTNVLFWSCDL
jgi:hypothetical protein